MDSESKIILVVDDELTIRLLLKEALHDEGYDVRLACHGLEALEIYKNNPIHLVILDLKMPEMDGIQALRVMKEIKPDIPIIFFTAYGEYKQDYATWASDDYFVKSSDLGELIHCIKCHLHNNQ